MPRRIHLRELRAAPKSLEGIALSIGRTFRAPSGAELNPGDAVPAEILSDPHLGRLIRSGYVRTSALVNYRALEPVAVKPAEPEPAPAPALEASSPSTKSEIKAALEALGVEVPAGATKAELADLLAANQ
jgi:hypothetical protein